MKTIAYIAMALGLSLGACAESTPHASSPSGAQQTAAARPDQAATRVHLEQHVKYPASKKEVLAACADTPEFTEGQKRWFEQNLPEGKYQSAADVMAALKL